jgi:uncharacterized protein (DUF2235 family)
MAKTIVFCADGTWDGPGQTGADDALAKTTNVFKLFFNLDGTDTRDTTLLANEQERVLHDAAGAERQWAKYIHGVGDSSNTLVRLLGGTLGAGLIARIVRGYTFISRHYEPGDSIIIVGFSRGAYTARALAGLICGKGLLDAGKTDLTNKDRAYRMGAAVWYAYHRDAIQRRTDLLGELENFIGDLPGFLMQPPADALLVAADIEAVAVWDTVGALGIPDFTLKAARVDAFQFADTALSAKVKRGLHAVSVDELRSDFTPTLWNADPSRIKQVLFPGSHSDVGGGNPTTNTESGLSDCALVWITEQLAPFVKFAQPLRHPPAPLPTGTAHQPWLDAPWNLLIRRARVFPLPPGLMLSQSLVARRKAGLVVGAPNTSPGLYNPGNIAGYLNGNEPAPGAFDE